MSAAAIAVPPAELNSRAAPPVPLYTRHMPGAIEADRDHRRQGHDRTVSRGFGIGASLPIVPADTVPATIAHAG